MQESRRSSDRTMKQQKKILIAIAAVCFAILKVVSWVMTLVLIVLIWKKIVDIEVYDFAYYGNWNQETAKMLQYYDFIDGGLPTKAEVQEYGVDFRYRYVDGMDPQFSISVTLHITNEDVLQAKLNEINSKDYDLLIRKEDSTAYYLRYNSKWPWMEWYFDEHINDALNFRIGIIEVNEKEGTIHYLAAVVWDYYHDKVLDEYLKTVYSYIQ